MFHLMLITDTGLLPAAALPAVVETVVAAGVDAVQLRDKALARSERLALGRRLRAVTRGRALLLVNGTVEDARACDADGVHLPETAPMPAAGQRTGLIVGRSVHSPAAARAAETEGADYL